MLSKILILSAMIFPFPRASGKVVRGDTERSSPALPMPVECLGPFPASAEDSPCLDVPLAVSMTRPERVMTRLERGRTRHDASSIIPFDRRKNASTSGFVAWLTRHDASRDMTRTRLLGLYFEYCELVDRSPLTERQFLNGLTRHGVKKTRPAAIVVNGKLHRPTHYRVAPTSNVEAA